MGHGDTSAAFCADLVAGLADAGVSTVFISPGSRNTPLVLALINEPRIADVNVRDERAAGFMAVGWAKATERPAAVVCTSGSAATHYFPSVVEADQSSTPFIVLTADRPARLRGTGAPQTMDQTELFGSHVKMFVDAATSTIEGRALGVDLVRRAVGGTPGPVHANLSFDEPLLPTEALLVPSPIPVDLISEVPARSTGLLDHLATMRTLIVASGRQRPTFGQALAGVADRMGSPVIADPQTPVSGSTVLSYGDLLAGAHDDQGERIVLDSLRPDAILRLGPLPTSKPLWTFFESFNGLQVHVDDSRLTDPFASRTTHVDANPLDFLVGEAVTSTPVDRGWVDAWLDLDVLVGDTVDRSLSSLAWPNEPAIARLIGNHVPEWTTLYVASSRPIRDIDAFATPSPDVRVLANRGVNGIDGTIASAIGAAASGTPTTLFIGDVAALHDASSLAEAASLGVPLRIVVVNNDGGGIFEFLPQATSDALTRDDFERHWGTPHGLSLTAIAQSYGLSTSSVASDQELANAVASVPATPELIEIATDRARVVADHEHLRHAVADAVLRRSEDVQEGS